MGKKIKGSSIKLNRDVNIAAREVVLQGKKQRHGKT